MGNERLLRNELCGRNHGRLHELLAPNSINQGSGKGEHDQYRNHIKKFPGQQGSPLLQCSIIRWLAILFLCPLDASYATLAFHVVRSEEHTSELQSLMRISYAVFCLK